MGLFSKAGKILKEEGKHLGYSIDRYRERMTVTPQRKESLAKPVKGAIRATQRYSKRVDKNLETYLHGKRRKKQG